MWNSLTFGLVIYPIIYIYIYCTYIYIYLLVFVVSILNSQLVLMTNSSTPPNTWWWWCSYSIISINLVSKLPISWINKHGYIPIYFLNLPIIFPFYPHWLNVESWWTNHPQLHQKKYDWYPVNIQFLWLKQFLFKLCPNFVPMFFPISQLFLMKFRHMLWYLKPPTLDPYWPYSHDISIYLHQYPHFKW